MKCTVVGGWSGSRNFDSITEALEFAKRDSGDVEITHGGETMVLKRVGSEFRLEEVRKNYRTQPTPPSRDDDWGT